MKNEACARWRQGLLCVHALLFGVASATGPTFLEQHAFSSLLEEKVVMGFLANYSQVRTAAVVARQQTRETEEYRKGLAERLQARSPGGTTLFAPDLMEIRLWQQGGGLRVEMDAITEKGKSAPRRAWMVDGDRAGMILRGGGTDLDLRMGYLKRPDEVLKSAPIVWKWCFATVPGVYPEEFLATGGKVGLVAEEPVAVGENQCYVLEWQGEYWRSRMYVDPLRGFVPVRWTLYDIQGNVKREVQVEDVVQVNGVFVPRLWTNRAFQPNGEVYRENQIELTQVTFNEPIPAARFEVAFPPEVSVVDEQNRLVRRGADVRKASQEVLDAVESALETPTGTAPSPRAFGQAPEAAMPSENAARPPRAAFGRSWLPLYLGAAAVFSIAALFTVRFHRRRRGPRNNAV